MSGALTQFRHPGKLSLQAISLWVGTMSRPTSERRCVNRLTARCSSEWSRSVIWRPAKKKNKDQHRHGPCGSKGTLRFLL